MKTKIQLFISISLLTVILFLNNSCKGKGDGGQAADSTAMEETIEGPEVATYCLWKEISIKDTIGSKGKWLATIYLAEKVEFLAQAVDSSDKKYPIYVKVRLIDGKEGWLKSDFVTINQKIGAILENTPMYSRPILTTKTAKEFSQMDVVTVIGEQEDWLQVKGKPRGETWFQTMWIKNDKLTYDKTDIAVAVFALRTFDQKDEAKKKEELQAILDNPDFEKSIFIGDIYNLLNDASMERLEIDFTNFPSSQVNQLIDYFAFDEVNIKDGYATIEQGNMKDLQEEVVRKLTSNFDISNFDQSQSRIKINYFSKVFLLLPDFLPKSETYSYYWDSYGENATSESRMLAFLIHKLDRNSSNINRLYERYKEDAFNMVDQDLFDGTNIGQTVDALIEAHQHIISIPDYKTKLKDIYNEAKNKNQQALADGDEYGYPISSQWELYEPLIIEGASYEIDQMWLLSFWVRRYAEDNMDAVYKILLDISQYYGESFAD